ncbi:MAG: hypothetical protein C4531_16815 [Desulfurivibrio sp.]|nr:MAG: hypothetical protein C4531_16815 [Desulfurivibrio sp.]
MIRNREKQGCPQKKVKFRQVSAWSAAVTAEADQCGKRRTAAPQKRLGSDGGFRQNIAVVPGSPEGGKRWRSTRRTVGIRLPKIRH